MRELKKLFKKINFSPIFETPFKGRGRQEDYYNLCARIETTKSIPELKNLFRAMEARFGRRRSRRKDAARELDLDLLLYGKQIDLENNVPYQGFERTAYVLVPLNSIAPGIVHPRTGKTVHSHLKKISGKETNRIRKTRF